MSWWWMSFADPDRPKGEQFLGVALVEADNEAEMMTRSWTLGCNPGGEIQFVAIDLAEIPAEKRRAFDAAPKHTLMSMAALASAGLLD